MNRRQKLVQKQFLNNEKAVIEQLDDIYSKSLNDITDKIKNLEFKIGELQEQYDWMDDTDPNKAKIKSQIQSKIYQKQYQQQLHKQVDDILNKMHTRECLTVSDYLDECYTDGFIGSFYDMQGQGVPLIMPIDQEAMVRAVQLESKISKGLYTKLGEDVAELKKKITAQVSRGISTGMSYSQVAIQLAGNTRIGYNKAVRIVRTEGHRIQTTATMDAMHAAKSKGADLVKQWDATLDGNTRESHQQVDGEIRELDKPFSNGLMFPGDPSGGPGEVINCRCALLQRARWAVEDEDEVIRRDNETGELIKCKNYAEFKEKYLSDVERQARINNLKVTSSSEKEQFERYKNVLGSNSPKTLADFYNIKHNDKEAWEKLKHQYRTVNRYEVNGDVPVDTILELDDAAWYTKNNGYSFDGMSDDEAAKLKRAITKGNASSMLFDDEIYYSHSRFGEIGDFDLSLYSGNYTAVHLQANRKFTVKPINDKDKVPREYDTEAKFLEFVATKKKPEDTFTVTILSEKHICESCQGVVEQFKEMFPNSTINIVSGKKGFNKSERGTKTYKYRKEVK